MHYTFDLWMARTHPDLPWCRYADDGLVHCHSEQEAAALQAELQARLAECHLEMHPTKTKIVYCKDGNSCFPQPREAHRRLCVSRRRVLPDIAWCDPARESFPTAVRETWWHKMPYLRNGVKHQFERAQRTYQFGVDPELVEQADRLHGQHHHRRKSQPWEPHPEDPARECSRPALAERGREVIALGGVMYHVPRAMPRKGGIRGSRDETSSS